MDKFYLLRRALLPSPIKIRKELKISFLLGMLFFSLISFQAFAQTTITGTVRDAKGGSLPGVSVKVKGTTTGAMTDENGKYTLKNVPAGATIVFSSISYVSQEVKAKNVLDIQLADDAQNLNEVLVVGYGTQKKLTVTGAVAQIGSEEIMRSPTPNATNTLVGKLTGLNAVQTSGQPGADASTIYIRGISTFSPGNAAAIVVVDGIERPSFGDVDPNEIETVTVLKDASATAIYGIRGANGVIVITTKVGKIGRAKVFYSGNYSLQTYTGLPFALGSYDNARLLNQAYLNDSKPAPWSDAELQKFKDGSDPYGYPDVQWFKYLTKKFYGQTQHNFNVSGGSKVARYFVSVGYAYQDGIFKHFESPYGIETTPSFTRYNFRSNVDLTLNKDFTVGIKLGGRYSNRYQPAGLLSSSAFSYDTIEGMISRILQVPSFAYPVTLPDGRIAQNPGVGTNLWNPLAVLTRFGTRNDDQNTIESTFNLNYKLDFITKGLSFKTNFGYDSYYTNVSRRNANWAAYVWDRATGAISLSTDTRNRDVPLSGINSVITGSTNTNIQTGFDYNRSFGKHNFSGLLLGTRQLIQGGSDPNNILFTAPPKAAQGLAGRAVYNYDEKYFVDFEASYNGTDQFKSSTEGEGKQYGFFPAVSVGWTPTKETFFPKNDVVTYAKLRASYGVVGNDKLNERRFLFLTSYSANSSVGFGSTASITNYPTIFIGPTDLGNAGITWEKGKKRDIGLDLRLFKDHLKVTADVYDENRTDILFNSLSGPASFGHTYPALNIGRVYNKGYEVEMDYEGQVGRFTFGLNAQLSFAKNVVKAAGEPDGLPDGQRLEGKAVGQFIGYVAEGFYKDANDVANSVKPQGIIPIPGDLKFKDLNGDGVITSLDQQAIGYSNTPQYIYSITPRVAYKGLSLTVMLQGVAHVSSNLILNDQNNGQQMYPFMLNAWTPETAETATWPALHSRGYTGLNNALNSFNIQNARYIKLRNVKLAYTLPKRITDPLKVQGISMFLSGQNLITWTPFKMYVDPENLNVVNQAFPLQSLYPSSRVYNIGVNINF